MEMHGQPEAAKQLDAKLRRALELVYGVEGVVAARVWHWTGRVAVGIRGSATSAPEDLLRRVEKAVAGLRDPDEAWDFGILDEGASGPKSRGDFEASRSGGPPSKD